MQRLAAVFIALLLLTCGVHAQSSKATLTTEINTNFADNTSGAITPAIVRTTLTDMVNSWTDWLTCTSQGGIMYWGASAVPACLAAGTSGALLQTNGAAMNPSWLDTVAVAHGGTNCAVASGTCLDNITGFSSTGIMNRTGAGAYAFSTLTALMDSGLCSTQGTVLYRGAATWSCLAVGTSGALLQTTGAASNPSWVDTITVAHGGTNCAVASGTCLDNITGFSSTGIMSRTGAATYTFSTLTALMDSGLCSTRGNVIYRGAASWSCLAVGTSGQVLQTGGAGADPSWLTVTGTGTVTSVGTSGCATGGAITTTGTVAVTPATTTQIWSAGASNCVDAANLNAAGALTALTDAATIALDMATFVNGTVTLGGNRTLGNPSNTQVGRTGCIFIVQDGTGTRTLAYSGNWKFAGGVAPVLTTTASAVDMLCYIVRTSSFIYGTLTKDVK